MTPQTRKLLLVGGVTAAAVLFLGGVFYTMFWQPYLEYDEQILAAEAKVAAKDRQLRKQNAELTQLDALQRMSLPKAIYDARHTYDRYLNDLVASANLEDISVRDATPAEKVPIAGSKTNAKDETPIYKPLTFRVRARGAMSNIVALLERFQETPRLHKIKSLTLERPLAQSEKNQITLDLTVEALSLTSPALTNPVAPDLAMLQLEALLALRRAPGGIPLLAWAVSAKGPLYPVTLPVPGVPRDYLAMLKRDPFVGAVPPPPPPKEEKPPPREEKPAPMIEEPDPGPDMRQFVYLTDITLMEFRKEAFLRNRLTNQATRLRTSPGFNTFRVLSESGERVVVQGKVLRIDPRDVYFTVNDAIYGLHVGQNLTEAMRRALTDDQLDELKLDLPKTP